MYSRSVKFSGITSPSGPPTLRNITSSNVERQFLNASHTWRSMTSHMTWYYPWGGLGQFFLAQNGSRIYPNMCDKFGCGPTVVSKKRGGTDRQTDRQADRQTKISAALYSRLGQFSMTCKVVGIFGEKLVNIHFYIIWICWIQKSCSPSWILTFRSRVTKNKMATKIEFFFKTLLLK